ncbi:type VII secretion system-associated protein [Streptomyces sp. NBS 14/10]|uniref:type VII secretion system-associated protein n=1 Tax=Streptomyces sp. NBS 14/10 TaxID=1945643 RepID=UPI000B802274|nr:type VII secretion system-associated protein [Streptomyces sp. NBS 14/10]KAK1183471.1 type VII secretion system-associated protein [Streptomyces sp. NBS 14/10]
MAEPIQLDKKWMEHFINHDVLGFQDELKKILQDRGEIPAVSSLKKDNPHQWEGAHVPPGTQLPLTIGFMAHDEESNGDNLRGVVSELIDQIVEMIGQQQVLFDDIEDNLRETVHKLLKTQGASLGKIDGEKILDPLEDVDDDLASARSGSGGGSAGSGSGRDSGGGSE